MAKHGFLWKGSRSIVCFHSKSVLSYMRISHDPQTIPSLFKTQNRSGKKMVLVSTKKP